MNEKLQQFETKMQKTCEHLAAEFATIRAGRANPHVLDKIKVNYYGTPTPIQQVGNVTVPEARIIQIAPWEKSLLKAIEKAILTSDITNSNLTLFCFLLNFLYQIFSALLCKLREYQTDNRTIVRRIDSDIRG